MDLSVHTAVADRLISLFLATGTVLARNRRRILLITQLLLRRGLESHQYSSRGWISLYPNSTRYWLFMCKWFVCCVRIDLSILNSHDLWRHSLRC